MKKEICMDEIHECDEGVEEKSLIQRNEEKSIKVRVCE